MVASPLLPGSADLPELPELHQLPELPGLNQLRDGARVVALPLVTRFRGIDVREALLLRGPEAGASSRPSLEYAR